MVNQIHLTDYQLALPQGLEAFPEYLAAYRKARANGSFIILDNGEAEGELYDSATLHNYALNLMVNEIVVPDTIGDAAATWQQTNAFEGTIMADKFNYMGVIQGANVDELIWMVQQYATKPWITTLGVPRHLMTSMLGVFTPDARVVVARWIHQNFPKRFKLHLLGTNPEYITELSDFRTEFGLYNVRGVDTSAPFNYAFANKPMQTGVVVNRPSDYFSRGSNEFNPSFLELNYLRLKKAVDN
jgi:hypothetical protein